MKTTKAILIIVAGLLLMFYPVSSKADVIGPDGVSYDWLGFFTSNHMSNNTETGPFGFVGLNQVGSDVVFHVELNAGYQFVQTGASQGYDFKFNNQTSTPTSIQASGVTFGSPNTSGVDTATYVAWTKSGSNVTGGIGGDDGGIYNYGIVKFGQPTGGAGALPGEMDFTVLGTMIADVTRSEPSFKNGPQIFVADILSPDTSQTGRTGLVDVSVQTVPEPGILILLGIAMSAIGIAVPFLRKI
jgi:hypothetical protein